MARPGLASKIRSKDQDLADVIEILAADHDVVSSPTKSLVASGNIPPGASVVVFSGGPTQTLTLPPASALGASVGAVVFLLNTSTNAVTVIPSAGNTVNGTTSLSVAANALCVLASDGVSKWLRNV